MNNYCIIHTRTRVLRVKRRPSSRAEREYTSRTRVCTMFVRKLRLKVGNGSRLFNPKLPSIEAKALRPRVCYARSCVVLRTGGLNGGRRAEKTEFFLKENLWTLHYIYGNIVKSILDAKTERTSPYRLEMYGLSVNPIFRSPHTCDRDRVCYFFKDFVSREYSYTFLGHRAFAIVFICAVISTSTHIVLRISVIRSHRNRSYPEVLHKNRCSERYMYFMCVCVVGLRVWIAKTLVWYLGSESGVAKTASNGPFKRKKTEETTVGCGQDGRGAGT